MAAAAAVAQLAAFSNVAAGAGGGGGNHAATTAENILDLSSKLLAQQQHQASHQTSPHCFSGLDNIPEIVLNFDYLSVFRLFSGQDDPACIQLKIIE